MKLNKLQEKYVYYQRCVRNIKGQLQLCAVPRDVYRQSYKNFVDFNAPLWIEMMDERNQLVHEYAEESFKELAERAY